MSVSPKVLVVDDDHALADLLVIMLSLEGFRAEAAYSGTDALASVAAELPAAVVLDIMMPDMDGFTVLRQFRANGSSAQLPVIMHSARVDDEAKDDALAAGANGFITKPADPHQITAELRSLIARQAGPGAA
jgi:DNA-binding response OmpR family regulator